MSRSTASHAGFDRVPVVDLLGQRPDRPSADLVEEVRRASHEVGFFYVERHGISRARLGGYFQAMRDFFALPEALKADMDKANSPHFRGWERLGSELTNNQVDYREQLDIGTERPAEVSPQPYYRGLIGPNQWPAEADLPGFRATVTGMLAELDGLSRYLLRIMSVALGLVPGHIQAAFGDDPQPYCKLIRYPRTPAGGNGVGAHKDSGFITLLMQDATGGLQAQNTAGRWIDVPPRPDSLVVNIGELLQIMSCNYFVATTHQVVNAGGETGGRERFSSAYFYSPDLDTPLEAFPVDETLRRAVAASPQHRDAGLMQSREQLLAGGSGISAQAAPARFGEKYWHRWVRSYPEIARRFYPEHV